MDRYEPQIGGPLDVRREKLPDFLNDILRTPESPGFIGGGPRATGTTSPLAVQEPKPPKRLEDPFRDTESSEPSTPTPSMTGVGMPAFPTPRSRGEVPPVPPVPQHPPYPQNPRTAATTPTTRTQSVLSIISEASLGGNSPNTQVEMRMAYQALKKEVGARDDLESDWGGTAVVDQDSEGVNGRKF
jgi:hypothetical protein